MGLRTTLTVLLLFYSSVCHGAAIQGKEEGSVLTYCKSVNFVGSSQTLTNSGLDCTLTSTASAGTGEAITVNTVEATDANFLDNIYVDFAIDTAASPDDITAKFNYAETLAGDPALLVDECVIFKDATGGGLLCEGSTADTAEQLYRVPDLNGSNTTSYFMLDDAPISAIDDASLEIASTVLRRAALTGDVTAAAGSNTTVIAADIVNGADIIDSVTIDGASLRLGDGGSNYTQFSTAGLQTYAGTARPLKRIFLSSTAGFCRTDNGCTDPTSAETTTNKVKYYSASFAADADDFWQSTFTLPENYVDGATFIAAVEWTGTTEASATVVWGVQLMSITDDDVLDTAFGSAITVSDDVTVTGDFQRTADTSAITASGSPVGGDRVWIQVYRDPDNASDDSTNAAKFLGVWLNFQVDALSSED